MKSVEEIREEISNIVHEFGYIAHNFKDHKKIDTAERKTIDAILSIKVGGEDGGINCPYCDGIATRSITPNDDGTIILVCNKCTATEYVRPKTLRDLLT